MALSNLGGAFNYDVKGPDITSPADLMAQQTQNALANQKLAESVRSIEARNALGKVFSQADPNTGLPPMNAMMNYAQQFPEHAMELQTHVDKVQQSAMLRKLEEERINKLKEDAIIKNMPYALSAYEATDKAYNEAVEAGDQDPRGTAIRKGLGIVEQGNNSGLYGGMSNNAKEMISGYDPMLAKERMAAMRGAIIKRGIEKPIIMAWEQVDPDTKEKGVMMASVDPITGKTMIRDPKTNEFSAVWSGKSLPPNAKPINLAPSVPIDVRVSDAEAIAAARERGTQTVKHEFAENDLLPESVLKNMARQAWTGDKSVYTNLGRGTQGAKNIVGLRIAIDNYGIETGKTPEELAAKNAEFEGFKASERTLGTREANINMAVTEAENLIPLALKASDELKRTGIKSVNDLIQYAQGKTASPELRRLAQSTNALINVYARAISPQGVSTVSDKDHARAILDNGFAQGDYSAAVDQMHIEMLAAQKSPGQVRKNMREEITGQKSPETTAPSKSKDFSNLWK